jgi:hypothetical protein
MAADKTETCAFHQQYADRIDRMWDWHIKEKVLMEQFVEKIKQTNILLGGLGVAVISDILARLLG